MTILNYKSVKNILTNLEKNRLLDFLNESKKSLNSFKFQLDDTGIGTRILIVSKNYEKLEDITDYASW